MSKSRSGLSPTASKIGSKIGSSSRPDYRFCPVLGSVSFGQFGLSCETVNELDHKPCMKTKVRRLIQGLVVTPTASSRVLARRALFCTAQLFGGSSSEKRESSFFARGTDFDRRSKQKKRVTSPRHSPPDSKSTKTKNSPKLTHHLG